MTDKRKPTYDLTSIQRSTAKKAMTRTALSGAADMGMTRQDMEDVIRALTRKDFYKSTTTFHDHRIRMDVYHGRTEDYEIYIKFVQDAVTEFSCTSFKEKD